MKHDPKATGYALAVVGGALYLICAVWTVVSRSSYMGAMNTWAHGIDLSALPAKPLDVTTLVIGFVTFVVVAWVSGYCFAHCYNYFASKK